MRRDVRFRYVTGLAQDVFRNAVLVGRWQPDGRPTEGDWTRTPMAQVIGPDGTPAFEATISLEAPTGSLLQWGVELDGPAGEKQWGIMLEDSDPSSGARLRAFRLQEGADGPQHEEYVFNGSRSMGAQKYYSPGSAKPALRFSVWAPNAAQVEVVLGALWLQDNGRQEVLVDPAAPVPLRPQDKYVIRGGYVATPTDGERPQGALSTFEPIPLTRDENGIWSSAPIDDFMRFDHLPYMFRIHKDSKDVALRTDLYSRCQIGGGSVIPAGAFYGRTCDLDGTVSCSVIIDADRVTKDFDGHTFPPADWIGQDEFWASGAGSKPRPTKPSELVIYELHLGALGAHTRGPNEPGTLEDAMALLDYLEELGVNAIELLPLSEAGEGGASWGYTTSHYFAIEYGGGGRDQYKWFIRECHRRGFFVILDVVYNHYRHNAERAEWLYDTNDHARNAYYAYQGRPEDYPDFNRDVPSAWGHGGYIDNMSSGYAPRYAEERVRRMFIDSAIALIAEFHVDGLRVDQTTSIRSYNVLHADGRRVDWMNVLGAKLIRELTRSLRFIRPGVILLAEDHDNWPGVVHSPDDGGLGFDGVWYADFYHHLIGDGDKGDDYAKLLKRAGFGGDEPLKMDYFAGALGATQGGHKVVYHESHDEAGNGRFTDRTIRVAVNGAPLVGATRDVAEARCRFAAAMTILSAGIPMFLFGEEVGTEKPFIYGKVLENREDLVSASRNTARSRLFAFYKALIGFRRRHPGLQSPDIDVVFTHDADRLIAFRRWGTGEEFLVFGSLNNRAFDRPFYEFRANHLPGGKWREVFNSDASEFGGAGVGNAGRVIENVAGGFACVVPARGVVVFAREP